PLILSEIYHVTLPDLIPSVLLLLFGAALGLGFGLVILVLHLARRHRLAEQSLGRTTNAVSMTRPSLRFSYVRRPGCWLAVRSQSLPAAQAALGSPHPKPSSYREGL